MIERQLLMCILCGYPAMEIEYPRNKEIPEKPLCIECYMEKRNETVPVEDKEIYES